MTAAQNNNNVSGTLGSYSGSFANERTAAAGGNARVNTSGSGYSGLLVQDSMANLGMHHPLSTKNLITEIDGYNPLMGNPRSGAPMMHNNFTGGVVKTTAGSTGSNSLTRKVEDTTTTTNTNQSNTENSSRVRQQGNVRIRATSASMRNKNLASENKGGVPHSGVNTDNIYNNMFSNNQENNNAASNRVASQERGALKEILNHQPTTVGQLLIEKRPSIPQVPSFSKENFGSYNRYPSSEDKSANSNLFQKAVNSGA